MEVGEKASMAVEGHTGQHTCPSAGRLTLAAQEENQQPGREIILELAITPSPEGCGHPESTGLGTRVSSDFPQELFIGKCSWDPLCPGCLFTKCSVQVAAKKTSASGMAFCLGGDECCHSSSPKSRSYWVKLLILHSCWWRSIPPAVPLQRVAYKRSSSPPRRMEVRRKASC